VDFTIAKYIQLLDALKKSGYEFQTFANFVQDPSERAIVLRHDVDAKKLNSLRFAMIEAGMGIKGTYYFRTVPQSFDRRVIREIATMGHEIGYHYETMDTSRGDVNKAFVDFRRNLNKFREIVPVKTVCMHGSPLSKYDNRSIWKKFDYKSLDLIGEAYFDIDFSKVLYLTDTGRRWDGSKVSVRDKVGQNNEYRVSGIEYRKNSPSFVPHPSYRSTNDIITAALSNELPDQLMLTFHPQRWTDRPIPWIKELVWQNAKNVIKRMIVR